MKDPDYYDANHGAMLEMNNLGYSSGAKRVYTDQP